VRKPDRDREGFWRGAVTRQQRSGQSVRQFCVEHHLQESSFYFWRRELKTRDARKSRITPPRPTQTPVFVPIRLAEQNAPRLEVVLRCGTTLRVPAGCDRDTLALVLALLEPVRC
jgi:hypothetical protein